MDSFFSEASISAIDFTGISSPLALVAIFKGLTTFVEVCNLEYGGCVSTCQYDTLFFQPLDLTMNGETKRLMKTMKDMFTTWYSAEVRKQMESNGGEQH